MFMYLAHYHKAFRSERVKQYEKCVFLINCFNLMGDYLVMLPSSTCSYGLRYQYGLFRQVILDGFQHEQPDFWLNFGNPWETERVHVTYPVKVCKYILYYNLSVYFSFHIVLIFISSSTNLQKFC